MNTSADPKKDFKFLEAKLLVKCVKANPRILLAHNVTLDKGGLARYNLTRVELDFHFLWRVTTVIHRSCSARDNSKTTSVHCGEK
jgi:hypothetical protein